MLNTNLTNNLTKPLSTKLKSTDINYSLYNFYVDFSNSTSDQISNEVPLESYIDDNKLNTYGEFTVLNGKSNDISDDIWSKNNVSTPSINEFQATSAFGNIGQEVTVEVSTKYTLSFYANVESGGNLTNYAFRIVNAVEEGVVQSVVLTETRERHSVVVTSRAAATTIIFGFQDRNGSNWSKVYIDTINVTASTYALPSTINTTISPVVIPATYADVSGGPKYLLTNMPRLVRALNGTDGTDAQGKLEVEWMPMFDYNECSTNSNILSCDETVASILYFLTSGNIVMTDKTNFSSAIGVNWVSNVNYTITLKWGPNPNIGGGLRMQTIVTDGDTTWTGALGFFDGSFNHVNYLSLGWSNSYWQKIKSIKIYKEPNW